MFELIRVHQLNIMFVLCVISATIGVLLFFTRFIPLKSKWSLMLMEFMSTFLLYFDRMAYIYAGDVSPDGYFWVRFSNFMVFFLTSGIVFSLNAYLSNMMISERIYDRVPTRLIVTGALSIIGMLLAVIAHFTGLYYSFDASNVYQRGPGFLIAYIIPVICPVIQYTVIIKNKMKFRPIILLALTLYIFGPIVAGIIQIFAYGISIVNMVMVIVSILLYLFTYLDINDEVERVHRYEMDSLKKERKSIRRIYDQTASAFTAAVEKKSDYLEGHSKRVANLARKLASENGMDDEESDRVYYAALFHDVGKVVLPNDLFGKEDRLSDEERRMIRKQPEISSEILTNIKEFPYLSQSVKYSCENYDGTGYPEGLKGTEIPEISRIIAVADAYDKLTTKTAYREALPDFVVREEFIKEAGSKYDPVYSDILVRIMDSTIKNDYEETVEKVGTELRCTKYRDSISQGIDTDRNYTRIHFECEPIEESEDVFSEPSIILFDSYDRRVHNHHNTIEQYHYLEFGEVWFDGHIICTGARNMEVDTSIHSYRKKDKESGKNSYDIIAARYEDHLKLILESFDNTVELIVALPDKSKSAYIGLTGENCLITGISIDVSDKKIGKGEIPRIADEIIYTDRLESDIPNIQIDGPRAVYTEGIPVKDGMHLRMHAMTLPAAALVWHCPYFVLFSSDDNKVNGANYREYAMVKLNGESNIRNEYAHNSFTMKKKSDFPGWETWKEKLRSGVECDIEIKKKGNTVTIVSDNLGVYFENATTVNGGSEEICVAITGDQVALTDIRIR
ncbi:MAG: HD domain-containing protein [Lachnospiraceae bacterium]|nr:HD domain-containing protein [Lachnospiraceae bacterium]